MKYMLMFCLSEEDKATFATFPPDAQEKAMGQIMGWLDANGSTCHARLQDVSTATTLRFKGDAAPIVTDGPYIEAKESVGGFAVIEAADLDAALKAARTWPGRGTVEVRPVMAPPQR
jgi:hypothetical protein